MKKIRIVLVVSLLMMGGCKTDPESGDSTKQSSKNAAVHVKSGEYITAEAKERQEGEKLLALELTVKNKASKSQKISTSDFSLYDDEGNKIDWQHIYTDDDAFKQLKTSKIGSEKSVTGYLVFPVAQKKNYELAYEPESDEEEDLKVRITPKDYPDHSEEMKQLVSSYVDQVFLEKEVDSKESKLTLGNDTKQDNIDFRQQYMDALKQALQYYEPSSNELENVVTHYIDANAQNSQIEYTVSEVTPHRAVVHIIPKIVHLANIDNSEAANKFIEESIGKYNGDTEAIGRDAEKYLMQEEPKLYQGIEASLPPKMKPEGYTVILTKQQGKWTLDTSDSPENQDFPEIIKAFMGAADV